MRRPIAFAITAGLMSLLGLIFWQGGISTDAAGARLKPEYGLSSNPYLPIRRLGQFTDELIRPSILGPVTRWDWKFRACPRVPISRKRPPQNQGSGTAAILCA